MSEEDTVFSRENSPRFARLLGVVVMLAVLVLAGCGGGGSGSSKNITVASKQDADSQLLGEMYTLLLQKAGYTVDAKIGLGKTPQMFAAIKSGQVDLYPEFTGTALSLLNLPATQDAHAAFNTVNTQYQQQFKITWLDAAYNLNDSYAICAPPATVTKYSLHALSDITPVLAGTLKLDTPSDGVTTAVNPVQTGYGIQFGSKNVKQIDAELAYGDAMQGNADLIVCYTTDANIVKDNFTVLADSKNVFPIYNPAPIIRNSVLSAHSDIKGILAPLATALTTADIVQLIKQVGDKGGTSAAVHDVAQSYLKSKGLL
jgi:osmoprotectant transport system substrate-binding protein